MNGQETEVKFYINDLKRLEARLQELGAALLHPRVHETNLRFDRSDGSLRAARQSLRLRRAGDVRLTYKGRSHTIQGAISREEIEFSVSDFESARRFLESLGYEPYAEYEKFRTTFQLDGAQVMLDELPYGSFVEIEGLDIEHIQAVASRLGLDWSAAIPASYLMLFEHLCGQLDLNPAQLTFTALNDFKPSPDLLHVRPADG